MLFALPPSTTRPEPLFTNEPEPLMVFANVPDEDTLSFNADPVDCRATELWPSAAVFRASIVPAATFVTPL